MNEPLLPLIFITFFTAGLLGVINGITYRNLKHPALHAWALSWGLYASRFLFDILFMLYPWAGFQVFLQLSVLLSGFFLLKGVYLYIYPTGRMPAGWAVFAGTAGIALLGGWLFPIPPLVPLLLSFFFLGLSNLIMGWYFLHNRTLPRLERLFVGLVFILWGLHKLDYPFLRPYPQFAMWGYAIGSILGFSAGTGLVFLFISEEHKRAEASESRIRFLIDSMHDAFFTMNSEGRITYALGHWFELEAGGANLYLGKTAVDILGPEGGAIHQQMAQRVFQENVSVTYEWDLRIPDGIRYFHTILSPVRDSIGNCIEVVGVSRDITPLRKALFEIQQRLEEKTVLIQEIQHRVQNNLQVIISLLNLQVGSTDSSQVKREFGLAISRIHTLADIYNQLQTAEDVTHIRIDRFLESLIARHSDPDLFPKPPTFQLDLKEVVLPIDKALPVGLIINELLHRCFEIPLAIDADATTPGVHILMDRNNEILEIRFSLSGCTEEFFPDSGKPKDNLRMELLESLVMHLEGRIEVAEEGSGIRVVLQVFESP